LDRFPASSARGEEKPATHPSLGVESRLFFKIQELAREPITPVHLPELIQVGLDVSKWASSTKSKPRKSSPLPSKLLSNAQFLQHELPIRLARRCRAFQRLPFIVGVNPNIHHVARLYSGSLDQILHFPRIDTYQDEAKFTGMLGDLVLAHTNVIPLVAQGFKECNQCMEVDEIGQFLDELIKYVSACGLTVFLLGVISSTLLTYFLFNVL
jgi:[3-methyl-2-oxobutanoate dehydrogenase (acetyl-transferring)] kinase